MKSQILLGLGVLGVLAGGDAHARGAEGHGGRVWICKDNGQTTYQFLDYEQAQNDPRHTLTLREETGADEYEIALKLVSKLERLEPGRAEIYRERVVNFSKRVAFTKVPKYYVFGDVKKPLLPPGDCEPAQAVYQIGDGKPYDPNLIEIRFNISAPIWSELSPFQRAGLIIHEIAYEDAINQGIDYADSVMELNAWLASNEIESLTPAQWEQKIKEWDLGTYQNRILLELNPKVKAPLKSQALVRSSVDLSVNYVQIGEQKLRVQTYVPGLADELIQKYWQKNIHRSPEDAITLGSKQEIDVQVSWAERDQRGRLTMVSLEPGQVISNGQVEHLIPRVLEFSPSLNVYRIAAGQIYIRPYQYSPPMGAGLNYEPKWFYVHKQGQKIRGKNWVLINGLGRVLGFEAAKSVDLKASSGITTQFKKGSDLFFDSQDQVKNSGGIFSTLSDQYVGLRTQGDQLQIEHCNLQSELCTQLGPKASYSSAQIQKLLNTRLRAPNNRRYWELGLVTLSMLGTGTGLIGAGAEGLALMFWLGGKTTLIAGAIWLTSDEQTRRAETSEAKKRIFKKNYLVTDLPIETVTAEFETVLNQIGK